MLSPEVWLQSAYVWLSAMALVLALILARRGVVAPLVVLGAVILGARASGFLLAYLGASEGVGPAMQVLIHYARTVPIVFLLLYACLMQAKRYRAARDNDRLRRLFLWVFYFQGAALSVNFVGDLVSGPALLESPPSMPALSFWFSIPNYVFGTVFAGVAAYVFFGSSRIGSGPPDLGQRLQNLFWGIAMAGTGMLTLYALVFRGIHAYDPEEALTASLAERLRYWEFVGFVIQTGGIVLGIFAYYTQSKRERFLERFASFLDLAGDLAEELATAPVTEERLCLPYATMLRAASKEYLDLPAVDRRRSNNAFRARAIWEHRTKEEGQPRDRRSGRINRRRLLDLAKTYEDELHEPVLAEGLRREVVGKKLPGTLRELLPEGTGEGGPDVAESQGLRDAVSLVLKIEDVDGKLDPISTPEWEQLAYVALAEGGLLPAGQRETILEDEAVSGRVLGNYRLAQYELQNCRGEDFPRLDNLET